LKIIPSYRFIIVATVLGSFLMHGCATLPEDFERPVSHAYTDTDDTRWGQARRDEIAAHPGSSGFLLLGNGLDAFVARAVLAHIAERSIDAQYYLLHNDLVGALFIDQLLKAADRGVRVRLLVDDMDLGGRDLGAAVLDSHPNMEVRIFNPFSRKTGRISQFVTRMVSVTRRMHNKSFVFDRQTVFIGSLNLDPRATLHNTEIGVVLESTELGGGRASGSMTTLKKLHSGWSCRREEIKSRELSGTDLKTANRSNSIRTLTPVSGGV